jgi:hypothetical protein
VPQVTLCEKVAVVRRKRGRDMTHADLGAALSKITFARTPDVGLPADSAAIADVAGGLRRARPGHAGLGEWVSETGTR